MAASLPPQRPREERAGQRPPATRRSAAGRPTPRRGAAAGGAVAGGAGAAAGAGVASGTTRPTARRASCRRPTSSALRPSSSICWTCAATSPPKIATSATIQAHSASTIAIQSDP